MSKRSAQGETPLVEKIQSLPPERAAEAGDFVKFIRQREDRQATKAAVKLSEKAFKRVWAHPADAAYDRL